MRILAIDTSSIVATTAVLEDTYLLGEKVLNNKMTHSQTLMPMIAELLNDLNMKVQDIDVIAVAKGPGSFTGLRIGAATAKGLAYAANKPLVAVSTLEALANQLPFAKHVVCPIMDAKRSQVYTALYQWKQEFKEMMPPGAVSIDDLIKEIGEQDVIFIGDGIPVYKEMLLEALAEKAHFAPPSMNMQKASAVGLLALQKAANKEFEDIYSFSPEYFRLSQAEREYAQKQKGMRNVNESK